jgi:hypothetical protein
LTAQLSKFTSRPQTPTRHFHGGLAKGINNGTVKKLPAWCADVIAVMLQRNLKFAHWQTCRQNRRRRPNRVLAVAFQFRFKV